jgi:hypothetical protein
MSVRMIAATAVTAVVAAAGATPGALPSGSAVSSCGKVHAGGRAWGVAQGGFNCSGARKVIRKLGSRPLPPKSHPQYPGTYSGMKCIGGASKGKRVIECIGRSGHRIVVGVAKAS